MPNFESRWEEYEKLRRSRPYAFAQNDQIKIVLDKEIAKGFSLDTGKAVGVIYKSEYSIFVVDLILADSGVLYTYERLLPVCESGAVVSVTKCGDRFILLRQFRHVLRDYEYSFPRGFGEPNISALDNVRKELFEEISGEVNNVKHLGSVVADSGILGRSVDVFLCEIAAYNSRPRNEGIVEVLEVEEEELLKMIKAGEIKDSYTLSGFGLYKAMAKKPQNYSR
jgi:ADP-ribose pyrophosphatase